MELKERLKQGLEHSRGFTAKVFEEIREDADWIRRPVPGSNHALWIAGHLGYASNGFLGMVNPDKRESRDNWKTLFGKGSTPMDNPGDYPAPAEVFDYWSKRSAALIAELDACSGSDLEREVPEGPAFMHDVAAVFQMGVWHEALHAGQLSVIHRMIGQTPLTER